MIRPALRIAIVAVLLLMGPVTAQEETQNGVVTVTGQGRASAVPDMAEVTLGVVARGATADVAMAEMSGQAAALLAILRDAGIADRDLRTGDLRLEPLRDPQGNAQPAPRLTGFEASTAIELRVRDLDRLGALLDAVTGEAANRMRTLRFGVQDPQPLHEAARRDAVADALGRAALYAEAAGLTLGPVLSISEPGNGGPGPAMRGIAMESAAAVPVARGEIAFTAQVRLRAALLP